MDLRDRRTSWLHSDKIHLVQGVKKQALVFLETKNRMAKLRADRMRAGGRSAGAKNGMVEELNSELEPIKEGEHFWEFVGIFRSFPELFGGKYVFITAREFNESVLFIQKVTICPTCD